MSKPLNRATRCSPCKKQASLSYASSLSHYKIGKTCMYSKPLINSRNITPAQPLSQTHSHKKTNTPRITKSYRSHTRRLTRSRSYSATLSHLIDHQVTAMLHRDRHRTAPPSSLSELSQTKSISQSSLSETSYQPNTTVPPLPLTQTRVTRQQTFCYPHSYDTENTPSQSSDTPDHQMSDTSLSTPTVPSVPPLRINANPNSEVSPLSYPAISPLQPYAHEQCSHSTHSDSSSISSHSSLTMTEKCRTVIENLSNHLTSPQDK